MFALTRCSAQARSGSPANTKDFITLCSVGRLPPCAAVTTPTRDQVPQSRVLRKLCAV